MHFAIKVPKFPPSNSVHFASHVRRPRAIRLVWYSLSLVRVAASKRQRGSSSCASTIFCKRPKPQTEIQWRFKGIYLSTDSELDKLTYRLFLKVTLSPLKIFTFPIESPCMYVDV
jgi:hypothetical protein